MLRQGHGQQLRKPLNIRLESFSASSNRKFNYVARLQFPFPSGLLNVIVTDCSVVHSTYTTCMHLRICTAACIWYVRKFVVQTRAGRRKCIPAIASRPHYAPPSTDQRPSLISPSSSVARARNLLPRPASLPKDTYAMRETERRGIHTIARSGCTWTYN